MKKFLAFVMLLFAAVLIVGCGKTKEPDKVTIVGPTTVAVGEDITFTVEEDVEVLWRFTTKTTIATLDEATGVLHATRGGTVFIGAYWKKGDKLLGTLMVKISGAGGVDERPNLEGYDIKIAQAAHALGELDPFHVDYRGIDKEEKQAAWTQVQNMYNCTISVVAYPEGIEWGEPRWNYILQQAETKVADYDFYTVPDDKIPEFVEGAALHDVTQWYALYGKGYMDAVYQQSGSYKGRLYSVTDGSSGIYNVMYYNINLVKELGLEEPAEIFNKGEWTFSKFRSYAAEADEKLKAAKGSEAFAVTGNPVYYWVGLSNASNVILANANTLQLDLQNPRAQAAGELIKAMAVEDKTVEHHKSIDQHNDTWGKEQASIFATGDLWFVRTANRWPEDMWGEGTTLFGYVPFPRHDDVSFEDQKVGLTGTATFVMPIGRDYTSYSSEVNAENIYRALVDTFLIKDQIEKEKGKTTEEAIRATAERFTDSDASRLAFENMSMRIINGNAFFDVLSGPGNSVANTGYSGFATTMYTYMIGTGKATYAEAVAEHEAVMLENLTKAFS